MFLRLLVGASIVSLHACGGGTSAARTDGPVAATRGTDAPAAPRSSDGAHGETASAPSTPEPSTAPSALSAAPAEPSASGAWPFATEPPETHRATLDRLAKDPGPQKSNWVPPGKAERYGHAEGIVNASPAEVKKRLVDFGHYKELAGPKFKQVRVVGKEGDGTEVYFQLPIMKGLVTIWYVTRFAPAKSVGGADVVEGTFVKGNIKGMHIALKVQPGPDAKSSVMTCDLLLTPSLPAPQSAVDEELRDACGDAIVSVRKLTGG